MFKFLGGNDVRITNKKIPLDNYYNVIHSKEMFGWNVYEIKKETKSKKTVVLARRTSIENYDALVELENEYNKITNPKRPRLTPAVISIFFSLLSLLFLVWYSVYMSLFKSAVLIIIAYVVSFVVFIFGLLKLLLYHLNYDGHEKILFENEVKRVELLKEVVEI